MGDFREPNSLQIDFDAFDYGMGYDASSERAERPAFEGITTSVLRSIPMVHAKALMQERATSRSLLRTSSAPFPHCHPGWRQTTTTFTLQPPMRPWRACQSNL
jgi:hypothetical protein